MFKIRFAINALAVFVFTLALASLAEASQQTFVSTSGNDNSATCGRANPCRTFNTTVSRTENGGEVIALDSGEYGTIGVLSVTSLDLSETLRQADRSAASLRIFRLGSIWTPAR